jgi:coenzyme F420-reducing hydrogenase beta subunit
VETKSGSAIKLAEKSLCTGCKACSQSCPTQCISFIDNGEGFGYPQIDSEKCIVCHICEKHCPIIYGSVLNRIRIAFASRANNREILINSASGGAFTTISEKVLLEGGVIYGCAWLDKEWIAKQIRVSDFDGLKKLQGSKYVESDSENTYIQVKNDLENGLWVLYSGRPCQIAGLKAYLAKEYETLITVDLVCHGVPSASMFKKYTGFYERKNHGKILEYKFRTHKNGQSGYFGGLIIIINGRRVFKPLIWQCDSYYYCFMKSLSYRDSCYRCQYAKQERVADITLGDFWGVEKMIPGQNPGNISLILVNSSKGYELVSRCNNQSLIEVDKTKACQYNGQLNFPTSVSIDKREAFRNAYISGGWQEVESLYHKDVGFFNYFVAYISYYSPLWLKKIKHRLFKVR